MSVCAPPKHWSSLPDDLQKRVARLLPVHSRFNLACCSRDSRRMVADLDDWSTMLGPVAVVLRPMEQFAADIRRVRVLHPAVNHAEVRRALSQPRSTRQTLHATIAQAGHKKALDANIPAYLGCLDKSLSTALWTRVSLSYGISMAIGFARDGALAAFGALAVVSCCVPLTLGPTLILFAYLALYLFEAIQFTQYIMVPQSPNREVRSAVKKALTQRELALHDARRKVITLRNKSELTSDDPLPWEPLAALAYRDHARAAASMLDDAPHLPTLLHALSVGMQDDADDVARAMQWASVTTQIETWHHTLRTTNPMYSAPPPLLSKHLEFEARVRDCLEAPGIPRRVATLRWSRQLAGLDGRSRGRYRQLMDSLDALSTAAQAVAATGVMAGEKKRLLEDLNALYRTAEHCCEELHDDAEAMRML